MSKVILEGYILVPDSDLSAVKNELSNHIVLTREEDGCLVFDVVNDKVNRNRFSVYEEFDSQNSFELHQQRVRNSKWGKIAANVERHYQVNRGE